MEQQSFDSASMEHPENLNVRRERLSQISKISTRISIAASVIFAGSFCYAVWEKVINDLDEPSLPVTITIGASAGIAGITCFLSFMNDIKISTLDIIDKK